MKKQIPVILGITRPAGNASSFKAAGVKLIPAEIKKSVFERDKHACQCCGFVADKYQDVYALNQDYSDVRLDNLATTCIFCHQCFHLEKVAEMHSGVFVWLPEITQVDLHHMARAMYIARLSQGPMADAARLALDTMMKRREDARARLGTDEPFVVSMVLKDFIGPRVYADRAQKFSGLRLFPLDRRIIKEAEMEFNQFPQILAYWRSKTGPFGGKVPSFWVDTYKDLLRKKAA